ncbi:mechanosensitive ion channel protein MscS [Roseibium polysiphoniae]|uniref:Mechanosensitive ion channel protein MscS n=1 Tax=Roseibium polysiphoniae TaxID=2571221 RepID=A0A944CF85_9HYPH|nr:mechanosensitive ion channel domain-containing protein [Roseibium polysiphoniae]MBS8260913.1 mechanosensitive ion channel protein MscS [Roseibium polysiphoniae]
MTASARISAIAFLLFACVVLPSVSFAQGIPLTGSATSSESSGEASDTADAEPTLDAASEALIKVLQNPESRDALIQRLKELPSDQTGETSTSGAAQAGSEGTASASQTDGDAAATGNDQTFAVRLGQYTRSTVDSAGASFARVRHALNGLVLLANGDVQVRWEKARQATIEVVLVLGVAFVVFLLGQRLLHMFFQRYVLKAQYGGVVMRVFLLAVTTLADLLTVGAGWAAGNSAALFTFGGLESGASLLESLALNAFLMTGVAKVGLRFVFAPERPMLRLLPFDDASAVYWAKRLGFVVSFFGYGQMLGVPVANLTVSFVVGNAVRVLVVLLAAVFLLALVRKNSRPVAEGIKTYAQNLSSDLAQRILVGVAEVWHWLAYLYILMVLGVWMSRPFDAVAIVMQATGYSILTIMGGFLVSLAITRTITGGIRLPEDVRTNLPALETRLNTFLPRMLRILRFVVFVLTVLVLLEIWGVLSLSNWLTSPSGVELLGRYGSAALVLLVAFAIWLAVMSWVDLRLREHAGYVVTARVRTLFQLFRNAFTVVIIVMAALLSLSEIGIDIAPLIAGAGVVGLAISFGAQTLVKDIITGAFIQIENAINEGDVVTVGGVTGTVERLTVRSVRMRDLEGTTHIVPFSSVDMVSNFMRDFSYHVAIIGVSYDTDIKHAKAALLEAFKRLQQSEYGGRIIGDLEMHGVTNFGDSAIDIRVRIKTTPGDQWSTGRAYNEFVKEVFDELGIEIPFPQVTYHSAVPAAPAEAGALPPSGKETKGQAKPRKTPDVPALDTSIAPDE